MRKKLGFWNLKFLFVSLVIVVDPLIVEGYHILVSVFKTSFNVSIELIVLSLTFHMLPLAILSLFSGTLSDLYNRPKMLMYGLAISSLGSFLAVISPNIYLFFLSRTLQGIGSAFIMPISLALIGDITPKEAIGKAMGFSGVISGLLGVTISPLLSGFLATIEWRLFPLTILIYTLTLSIVIRIVLRGLEPTQKNEGLTRLFQQIKQTARNRNIALLSVTGFVSIFTFQGIMPLISDVLSLPPLLLGRVEVGIAFSIVGFVGILASFVGGFIADRLGNRKSMILSFLLMLPFTFLLTFANSYGLYIILLSLLASFNRLTFISRSSLMVELTPESRGTASSILSSTGFLGFATAPVILTQLYSILGINSIYLLNIVLLTVCVIFTFLIHINHSR